MDQTVLRKVGAALGLRGGSPLLRPRGVALVAALLLSTSLALSGLAFAQTEDPPLEGEAYTAAEDAYAAYAAQDFARAAASAQRSLALRPDVMRLRLVLIDALIARGSDDEAARAIAEAEARGGASDALHQRRATLQQRNAQSAAAEAYRAMDRKDYAQAATAARQAIAATPSNMAYRLLLLNALIAQNNLADATAAANDAIALNRTDPVPLAWRGFIAQKRGDRAAAVADFDAALALPGVSERQARAIRLIAADAALAANDPAAARTLLDRYSADDPEIAPRLNDAIRTQQRRATLPTDMRVVPQPTQDCVTNADSSVICSIQAAPASSVGVPYDPAADAANRAFVAQRAGALPKAIEEAQNAVAEDRDNIAYRTLLVDLLMAAGRYRDAETAASDALSLNENRGHLLAQRGYARDRLKAVSGAIADWNAALQADLPANEARTVRLAIANATQRGAPSAYETHAQRGFTLQKLGRNEEALAAFQAARRAATTPGQRDTALRAEVTMLSLLGRKGEALALLNEARGRGGLRTVREADLAYLYADLGDNATALTLFDAAKAKGQLPARASLDAGYAATREFQNQKAIAYFEAGLDAAAEGAISVPPQQLYDARRQMADLTRRWGIITSATYGKVGAAPNPFSPVTPTGGYTAQLGTELYYRPESFGYRNGAIFDLFVRLFDTLYDQNGGPTGANSLQGMVGARWKPFSEHNLVFEADKLFRLGANARNDTLLRVAYSYAQGTDLNPVDWHWWTWQVYGEAGRYFETPQTILLGEGRFGHSFRVGGMASNLVLFPHAVVAGSYDTSFAVREAVSAGAGASLRFWFGETRYVAPPSYLELTLQYRFRVTGDRRAEGVYAQAVVNY